MPSPALKDLLERTHSPGAFKHWKHSPNVAPLLEAMHHALKALNDAEADLTGAMHTAVRATIHAGANKKTLLRMLRSLQADIGKNIEVVRLTHDADKIQRSGRVQEATERTVSIKFTITADWDSSDKQRAKDMILDSLQARAKGRGFSSKVDRELAHALVSPQWKRGD